MGAKNIVCWVIAVLNGALFIFAGQAKLHPTAEMLDGFAKMGFPPGFMTFLGVCEVLGGIGLFIPRTRFWAAVGLIPIMLGANYLHITRGEWDHLPPAAFALITLAVFIYLRREEAKRFASKGPLLTGA